MENADLNGGDAEFLNKDQVAAMLCISRRTVDYMMARKQLPFFRFNRRLVRFRRADILEHVQRNYRVNPRELASVQG